MTQFRSRDEQILALGSRLFVGMPNHTDGTCEAIRHIDEAEARGAAEATKNSAPAAWQVRDMRGGVGDWKQCSESAHEEYKKHSTVETRALYTRPTNVAALEARANGKPIHIVFAGEPGPGTLHFVEVEDGKGNNIRVGDWVKRSDGLLDLVIPVCDAANVAALEGRVQELEVVLQKVATISSCHAPRKRQGVYLNENKRIRWVSDTARDLARAALKREGGM